MKHSSIDTSVDLMSKAQPTNRNTSTARRMPRTCMGMMRLLRSHMGMMMLRSGDDGKHGYPLRPHVGGRDAWCADHVKDEASLFTGRKPDEER